MAESVTNIYNMALGLLGGSKVYSLQNPSEQSPEAAKCNLFYPTVRREALEAHHWGFASKISSLALVPGTGTGLYSYRYELPADCISPVRLSSGRTDEALDYRIFGREVWCAASPAWLEYVADTEDVSSWPAYFISLVVAGLAAAIAMPIRNDVQIAQRCAQAYADALAEATTRDRAKYKLHMLKSPWVQVHEG